MKWRRHPSMDPSDPHGIADLLVRVGDLVNQGPEPGPVGGTRFVTSTREMLRISRMVEAATLSSPGGVLYVGFQHTDRVADQADVYRAMAASGTAVHAFATAGDPPDIGARWSIVEPDRYALTSQWFLVRPERDGGQAMVGFQIHENPAPNGQRRWEGFATRDPRLVTALAEHLSAAIVGADQSERQSSL